MFTTVYIRFCMRSAAALFIHPHAQRNALRPMCLIISYKGRLVFLSPQFKSCRKIQSSVHSVLCKCSRQVKSHFIYSSNSSTKVISWHSSLSRLYILLIINLVIKYVCTETEQATGSHVPTLSPAHITPLLFHRIFLSLYVNYSKIIVFFDGQLDWFPFNGCDDLQLRGRIGGDHITLCWIVIFSY